MRPAKSEYPEYFEKYVALVREEDVQPVLESQIAIVEALPARVGAGRESYAYAPGKWPVRVLLGHVNDGERVFAYRALTFSRFDDVSLPSFDQDTWTPHGHFEAVPLRALADEFVSLRRANVAMLRRLDAAQWNAAGTASGNPITVRALAYVMAGHVRHHLDVLREKYSVA